MTRISAVALAAVTLLAASASLVHADLYISDGDRVGRYDNAGNLLNANFITAANVSPTIQFGSVTGLTFGPDGLLYVACDISAQVFRFNPLTGVAVAPTPFVLYHGVPGSPQQDVHGPEGIRFGLNGHLYVADVTDSNLHEFDGTGSSVTSYTDAQLAQPVGLTSNSASVFYMTGDNGVTRFDPVSHAFTTFNPLNPADPIHPVLSAAQDLTFGPDGKLYVLDISGSTLHVVRFNANDTYDATIIDFIAQVPDLTPDGIAFGPDGKLYISGSSDLESGGSVWRFLFDGTPDGEFISANNINPDNNLTFTPTFMVFSPSPVPEPASLGLLLLGAPLILRRRRV